MFVNDDEVITDSCNYLDQQFKSSQGCISTIRGYSLLWGKNVLLAECKVCRNDPELYGKGLFYTTLGKIKDGHTVCDCGIKNKLPEEKYFLKISRIASSENLVFDGFIGGFQGHNSRILLRCERHGTVSGKVSGLLKKKSLCSGCNRQHTQYLNKSEHLTQDYLKEMFDYRNGALYYKARSPSDRFQKSFNTKNAGKRAGFVLSTGYRMISLLNTKFLEHRLIFLWHHGFLPEFVDHINGLPIDNRVENLRGASHAENMSNTKISKNNASGSSVKGVYKHGNKGAWRVQIMHNGTLFAKGGFKSMHDAEEYANDLRKQLHKDFARDK